MAALPWRLSPAGVEILLVTSLDTGRWVLPKGWAKSRESLHDAAAREAAEEAGISGGIDRRALGSYRYLKRRGDGDDIACEVQVFPLETDRLADKWPERKKRTRTWFTPAEAMAAVHEPDLAALIAIFCADPRRTRT